MKFTHKRCIILLALLCAVFIIISALLNHFSEKISFFYTPTQAMENKNDNNIRVGGLVLKDSIIKTRENIEFYITDYEKDLKVIYDGVMPNLFREGQGVVALGYFQSDGDIFIAKRLLIKHDERYKPPSKSHENH